MNRTNDTNVRYLVNLAIGEFAESTSTLREFLQKQLQLLMSGWTDWASQEGHEAVTGSFHIALYMVIYYQKKFGQQQWCVLCWGLKSKQLPRVSHGVASTFLIIIVVVAVVRCVMSVTFVPHPVLNRTKRCDFDVIQETMEVSNQQLFHVLNSRRKR